MTQLLNLWASKRETCHRYIKQRTVGLLGSRCELVGVHCEPPRPTEYHRSNKILVLLTNTEITCRVGEQTVPVDVVSLDL